jgi:peptide/nickel transport system permease protein
MPRSIRGFAMATLDAALDREVPVAAAERRRPGLGALFWLAVAWIAIVLLLALAADLLPVASPFKQTLMARRASPSAQHLFGTDGLGRDVLSRLIHGARISLAVGFTAPLLGTVVGTVLGVLAGYFRGRFETLAIAATDVLLAFPPLVLALAIIAYLGASVVNLIIVLGILTIPAVTRVARATTLSLREREFVIAARALGASHARILRREILPNVLVPLGAFFLLLAAVTIIAEGILSYLGLGVPPPAPSWGSMIAEGRDSLAVAPHVAFIPAAAMFLTVISINLIGDTLRASIDPRRSAL